MRISFLLIVLCNLTTLTSFKNEMYKDQTIKAIIQKNLKALTSLTKRGRLWINEQNPEKSAPADICARSGNAKLMKFLIDQGANAYRTDIYGKTPLMYAVEYLNSECIFVLLTYGANPLKKDLKGHNALWYAMKPALGVKSEKQQLILYLLKSMIRHEG